MRFLSFSLPLHHDVYIPMATGMLIVVQLWLTIVQLVAHPVGQAVAQVAYTVSVAVRVQHGSEMHGWVIVSILRHSSLVQWFVLKLQDDHGAGVSTLVIKDGQLRCARVVVSTASVCSVVFVVVMVLVMMVM